MSTVAMVMSPSSTPARSPLIESSIRKSSTLSKMVSSMMGISTQPMAPAPRDRVTVRNSAPPKSTRPIVHVCVGGWGWAKGDKGERKRERERERLIGYNGCGLKNQTRQNNVALEFEVRLTPIEKNCIFNG